jgi:hypothetical protein
MLQQTKIFSFVNPYPQTSPIQGKDEDFGYKLRLLFISHSLEDIN